MPQASPQIQENQRSAKLEGRTAKEEVQTRIRLCQMKGGGKHIIIELMGQRKPISLYLDICYFGAALWISRKASKSGEIRQFNHRVIS